MGVLIGASAALAVTLLPGSAAADPGDAATSEEAARLVAEASHELEVVTEKFNEAREVLRQQQAAVDEAEKVAAEADDELASLDGRIRDLARTAYTSDSPTALDLMLSSDSADDFVSSLSTLEVIAGHTDDAIDEVEAAADEAESARAAAEAATEEAAETVERIRDQQADLEAQIADFEEQYEALSAGGSRAELGGPGRGRHRHGADRRPVRLGGGRTERLRLLGPDPVRLRRGRREPAALEQHAVADGHAGVAQRAAAG